MWSFVFFHDNDINVKHWVSVTLTQVSCHDCAPHRQKELPTNDIVECGATHVFRLRPHSDWQEPSTNYIIEGGATQAGKDLPTVNMAYFTETNKMSDAQLMQQLALLWWLKSDSVESKDLLTAVTSVQVGREILHRLSGQDNVDIFKRDCIQNVVDFVKKKPQASQQELNAEVEKQVLLFASRVQALESTPLAPY
uniref:Uncharacterized protein n=1 Tax=Denticeps clupeoides TaxID=299321 RepID=A0AAY4A7T1_9TELE